jgi:hypothetical protein
MSATAGPTIVLNPPDNPFFVNALANHVNTGIVLDSESDIPELPQPEQQPDSPSPSLSSANSGEQFPSPSNSSQSVTTPGRYPTTRTRGSPRVGRRSKFGNSSRIRRVGKKKDVRANDVWSFYKEHSGRHECVFCL